MLVSQVHCWQPTSQPASQLATSSRWGQFVPTSAHPSSSPVEPTKNLQNLPTRFNAPKALQRRALYRSELPQVQEAKPGTFWDALGRSELACSKHCGTVNVLLAQKLHVMHCPNCCDAIGGCHGGLLWRRHTCATRGMSRAPNQANLDTRRDSAAYVRD